jgi:hypothetical protein
LRRNQRLKTQELGALFSQFSSVLGEEQNVNNDHSIYCLCNANKSYLNSIAVLEKVHQNRGAHSLQPKLTVFLRKLNRRVIITIYHSKINYNLFGNCNTQPGIKQGQTF